MRYRLALSLTLLLSACGGGTTVGGTPEGIANPAPAAAPARGSLIGSAAPRPVALSSPSSAWRPNARARSA